jgi:hypothetical protein
VQDWIGAAGAKTAHIEQNRVARGKNSFIESFNARFRDEFVTGADQ